MAKDKTPPLIHRVTIQEDTGTGVNASGEHVPVWTAFATNLYANVEILSGRERFTAQQVVAELDAKITLHWKRGLHTGMRARWVDPEERRTRYFNFSSITPAPQDDYDWNGLVINAVEIPPPADEAGNPP